MNSQEVIVFENLHQRTGVIGQYDKVSVVSKPFVSNNAHGVFREVKDYNEIGFLAAQSGRNLRKLLSQEE